MDSRETGCGAAEGSHNVLFFGSKWSSSCSMLTLLLLSTVLMLSAGYWLMESNVFKVLLQNRKEERDGVREDVAERAKEHGPTAGGMYC